MDERKLREDVTALELRVKALEKTQSHIESLINANTRMLNENSKTLKDIKDAMVGNAFQEKGLIATVSDNVQEIEALKLFKTKLVAYTTISVAIAVTGIEIIAKVFF